MYNKSVDCLVPPVGLPAGVNCRRSRGGIPTSFLLDVFFTHVAGPAICFTLPTHSQTLSISVRRTSSDRRVLRRIIAVSRTSLKTITAVPAGTTGRRLLSGIPAAILHTCVMDRAFYRVCAGRTADFERYAAVNRRRRRRDNMRRHVYVASYTSVYTYAEGTPCGAALGPV